MHDVNSFLNRLRLNSGAIWLEQDSLKLSTPPSLQTQEIREFITTHKEILVGLLKRNNIDSKQEFLRKKILVEDLGAESLLSSEQERLWFIEQLEGGTDAYHIPMVYELYEHTDEHALKYALSEIVQRHEVLRSTISYRETSGHPVQNTQEGRLSFETLTVSSENDYLQALKKDIHRPFRLNTEWPVRITFYHLNNTEASIQRRFILIIFHHIAFDGWSEKIFEKELKAYYDAYLLEDASFKLPGLEIQYKDYAAWQKTFLSGEILEEQSAYWKNKLTGYQPLEFPLDYARGTKSDYRGADEYFTIPKHTSQQLKALAQKHDVTLHTVMLSALSILLHKYTGQHDIITGSPSANRHHHQTRDLIGFFVNAQVNRVLLNDSQNFEELIVQVHQDQLEAQLYQDLPFEKLLNELQVERNPSRHPVFQIIFEVRNFTKPGEGHAEHSNFLKPYQSNDVYSVEKFDMSIFIMDGEEGIAGLMSYATSLFDQATIHAFIQYYVYLLDLLVSNPSKPYSKHRLLDHETRKTEFQKTPSSSFIQSMYDKLVLDFNAIPKNYDGDYCPVIDLFTQQATANPGAPALVYKDQTMTYGELNERSSSLAHYLQTKFNIERNTPVGILLDRSDKLLITILATLKSGGAYVPVDPTYPQNRKAYILEDAHVNLLITQTDYLFDLDYYGGALFAVDVELDDLDKNESSFQAPDNSNLAYVIYTSGSTGQPKGCAISHGNLSHYIQWANNYYFQTNEQGNFALYTSLSFDLTVTSIFCTLSRGKCLTIYPQHQELTSVFEHSFSEGSGIDTVKITPSHINLLEGLNLQSSTIARAIVGGEAMTESHVQVLKKINPSIRIYNEYGPTESTVGCVVQELQLHEPILIGKPIFGTQIYILNSSLELVPMGALGEICIGGLGVGQGYLNKEELTKSKFIANPFAAGERLYRTGDLGRWLSDGRLEYKGRNDDQVKIRGYRIEPGEIEQALLQIEGIRQACVIAKDRQVDAGKVSYLVAYYIVDGNSELKEETITETLSMLLPEYMVPGILLKLDEFPLTANGKLNKEALPDPGFNDKEAYIKPETELEKKLSGIYADVLGLPMDNISTHQDFFRMGGNSILSIQLKLKLNGLDEFKHFSVADLFKFNSIKKLVQAIQQDNALPYKFSESRREHTNHEIAIIGVSGAFSGGDNIEEFWQLIANQREGVHVHSKDECKELNVSEEVFSHPGYIPVSGKVKNIDLFDPSFWDISPNEAKQLDPQIRKFIEHSWWVLESSGYAPQRRNLNVGVFAGSGVSDYFHDHILQGEMAADINIWEASVSNSKDALATKTAFFLDLTGPALSVNTACSTSLVSIVEACKNLQFGSCNMAIAGGVSLALPGEAGYIYEEGMILSKDGHCRTFDNEASGTLQGSGVGVVLLKRLDDAVKDGDTILGVIKGYASNNDGARKTGYTAPSVVGQSECIITAQKMAGIASHQMNYIECHGTATHLGDPIEIKALKDAFQYNQGNGNDSKRKTSLGAVKANIGHADAAAGIASLIKVCCMLKHEIIPGQANFNTPNTEFQLEHTPFEINKENKPWPATADKQRLAGVSSFGIGGTNAHVIIGDYIKPSAHEGDNTPLQVNYSIPLSAKSRFSLKRYKEELISYLKGINSDDNTFHISNIAYSLQERKETFRYRTAYTARNTQDLIHQLDLNLSHFQEAEENNKVVFMFPGQGSQYRHMAQALYEQEPGFRQIVEQCIALAKPFIEGTDMQALLFGKQTSQNLQDTQWTQISLFIIEYSLATYLELNGLKADAYIGHSIGEFVAATLAGVFNLKDAIRLVIERGRLMQAMQKGAMLAIQGSEQELIQLIRGHQCEIAVINSVTDFVVSGRHEAVLSLQESLKQRGIASVFLHTSHAYHSEMMDPAAAQFISAFEGMVLNSPSKPFMSNLSGEIAGEEVTSPEYWSRQLRHTVQFGKGLRTLGNLFNQQLTFLEVGPGKSLCAFVNSYKNKNRYNSVQSLQLLPSAKEADNHTGIGTKEELRGLLWSAGLLQKPNDDASLKGTTFLPDLPLYPFDFQKCWLEKKTMQPESQEPSVLPKEDWFSYPVWAAVAEYRKHNKKQDLPFKKTLIFIRPQQINDVTQIAQELTTVVLDEEFNTEYIGPDEHGIFRVNPADESHFKLLADYFRVRKLSFDTLLHACSLPGKLVPETDSGYGFYTLFLIRQWLLELKGIERLMVLTTGLARITGDEEMRPLNGTMVGAIRNINHEFPALDARIIDIGEQGQIHDSMQAMTDLAYHKSQELLATRFGKLWKERFEKLAATKQQAPAINEGDLILISGGLGGVALAIADHIAQRHQVRFLMISRKGIKRPENSIDEYELKTRLLEGIRNRGSIVDMQCCDLANAEEVQRLGHYINDTYGTINGIIHTAGVQPLDPQNYRLHTIKQAMEGKVYGIINLLTNLERKSLRFVAMTSSIASIMGDINRIEYCAANSFLDYLAADQKRFGETKVLSINWPGWITPERKAGNKEPHEAKAGTLKGLERLLMLNTVSHREGADLFYKLLNQAQHNQLVFSKLDIASLKRTLFKPDNSPEKRQIVDIMEKEYSEQEYLIAQIFAGILGMKQISVHDDFFRIGGNSIMAIQASHKISHVLNADIKVADIFRLKCCRNIAESVMIRETHSENVQLEF